MGTTDAIESQKAKYKRRMKRICCCGVSWFLIGIVLFAVAIGLLVGFAQYWDREDDGRRGLAYTGVALLLVGIIMVVVGIIFCVVLYMFYQRLSGDHSGKPQFKPPVYAYGDAPYPQQPPSSQAVSQGSTETTDPSHNMPSAPMVPNEKGANPADVNVEVSDNTKF